MKLVIVALAVTISGSAFAATKIIKQSTLMYPGAAISYYMDIEGLVLSDQARDVCPNGVAKILKATATVTADFDVTANKTQARTYPKVTMIAEVECN